MNNQNSKLCEPDGLVYLSMPPQSKCKNCGQFWHHTIEPTPVCKEFIPHPTTSKSEEMTDRQIQAEWKEQFEPRSKGEGVPLLCPRCGKKYIYKQGSTTTCSKCAISSPTPEEGWEVVDIHHEKKMTFAFIKKGNEYRVGIHILGEEAIAFNLSFISTLLQEERWKESKRCMDIFMNYTDPDTTMAVGKKIFNSQQQ